MSKQVRQVKYLLDIAEPPHIDRCCINCMVCDGPTVINVQDLLDLTTETAVVCHPKCYKTAVKTWGKGTVKNGKANKSLYPWGTK